MNIKFVDALMKVTQPLNPQSQGAASGLIDVTTQMVGDSLARSAEQLTALTGVSDPRMAATVFHSRVIEGLGQGEIPPEVQGAFNELHAEGADVDVAARSYYEALAKQLVESAFNAATGSTDVVVAELVEAELVEADAPGPAALARRDDTGRFDVSSALALVRTDVDTPASGTLERRGFDPQDAAPLYAAMESVAAVARARGGIAEAVATARRLHEAGFSTKASELLDHCIARSGEIPEEIHRLEAARDIVTALLNLEMRDKVQPALSGIETIRQHRSREILAEIAVSLYKHAKLTEDGEILELANRMTDICIESAMAIPVEIQRYQKMSDLAIFFFEADTPDLKTMVTKAITRNERRQGKYVYEMEMGQFRSAEILLDLVAATGDVSPRQLNSLIRRVWIFLYTGGFDTTLDRLKALSSRVQPKGLSALVWHGLDQLRDEKTFYNSQTSGQFKSREGHERLQRLYNRLLEDLEAAEKALAEDPQTEG